MRREARIGSCKLTLETGDITKSRCEAIVNAANSSLMGGGGVDGAIHAAAGPEILGECKAIVNERGRLPAGEAVITTGGQLPASWVIHTVGPVWHGGGDGEAETLASAYRESLDLAASYGIQTVAFPSVSTGAYGYPADEAARVALSTVADAIAEESCPFTEVRFVLYDPRTYEAYSRALDAIIPGAPGG
jgi:O-acetyl-ADP-ribose deacetylase